MDVTSKTIETNRVELTITVTAEEFEKGLDIAFEAARKNVTVEGFRKGKIPRKMFEKKFGVDVLFDDAVNAILPDVYRDALLIEDINPIGFPEWDVKQISKEGFVATATIWVKPVVELGEYKGLEVTRLSEEVTDEDVQAEIDNLAARYSEMIIKDGAAQLGDTVVIDFEGFKESIAFEGGKGENHPLNLGSNSFIPGFEEQVVGMAANDEKDINLTFPTDYQVDDLAGVAVVFKVKVHEVKTRQLPAIDDEFVKDLDQDSIETVEELRASILEKLTKAKKTNAENHVMSSVIEQTIRNANFEVPDIMVENEISNLIRRMEQQYKEQGIAFDEFLQYSGQTMESLRAQMKPQAILNIDQSLVIGEVVEKENIEVSDDDIEKELANVAKAHGMTIEQIKKMNPDLRLFKEEIKSRKAIEMMVESAV